MPQPNFVAPAMVGPPRVNWQEQLEQGFQARQAQRRQNRGGQRRGQNEGAPMAAGPPAPMEGRVNWQERLEYGFQKRHGGLLEDQNNAPPQQFIMGRRETYAEEERQHAAHQHNLRLQNDAQRQIDHD